MEKLLYVADQIREIEEFVRNNQDTSYDDVLEHVDNKLIELAAFAKENNIPFIADAEELVSKNREEESSSYEEESSSYYEEEESYYDEDEDEEEV